MPEKLSAGADKLQFIDAYAAAGFRLTPIRTTGPNKGKAPLEDNWTSTQYEPLPPHELYQDCNFGVVLDDTHLVIDIDPQNYPAGRKVWTELSQALGLKPEDLKKTFIVQTGRGGKHIYFKKPAGIKTRYKHPDYPGLDFPSIGRQVIGAGSTHPDTGKVYTPISQNPSVIADIPDALLAFLTVTDVDPATVPAVQVVSDDHTDTPQAIERFKEYLDKRDPAKPGARNNACYVAACRGKEFGLSEASTFKIIAQNMKFDGPLGDDEMRTAVRSAFRHSKNAAGVDNPQAVFKKLPKTIDNYKDFDRKGGKALATLANLCRYLRLDEMGLVGMFSYNELLGSIETTRPVPWAPRTKKIWDDNDNIQLKHYISAVCKVEYSVSVIDEGVRIMAAEQSFHPVKIWLDGLKWDGKPRLDTWLTRIMGVVDNPYTRAAGAITIMASIARMYNPGCKFDYMLILEGPQGVKKTQTIEHLAGGDPNLFCSTSLNLDNLSSEKDTIAIITNVMFVELAELVMNTKGEAEQVKAFLTRRFDKVRLPYGRHPVTLGRQCVFIGTTNPENGAGYFRDTTGNRRFWPVVCTHSDLLTLELEREQMFAEAKERVLKGEKLYMEDDVEALAEQEQQERVMIDPWQDLVDQYADKTRVWLTEEIYRVVLKCDPRHFGTREQRRIAAVMRQAGFEYDRYFHAPSGCRRRAFKHPSYNIELERDKVLEKDEKILDNGKD